MVFHRWHAGNFITLPWKCSLASRVNHRIFHTEPTNTISVIYDVSCPHSFFLPWPILSLSLYEIAHSRDLSNTEEASPVVKQISFIMSVCLSVCHSIHETVGKKYPDDQLLNEISKSAHYRHFTIKWGHGRGIVNGSEAIKLHHSLNDKDNVLISFILYGKYFLQSKFPIKWSSYWNSM